MLLSELPTFQKQIKQHSSTITKAPLAQIAKQKAKCLNFEQLIENQRDLNFLDKLIAEGDIKYGGVGSPLFSRNSG